MLTDEEKRAIRAKVKEASGEWHFDLMMFANEIEKAVLAKAGEQEPVYHVKGELSGTWIDVEKFQYELMARSGNECRIIYAHPLPAQAIPENKTVTYFLATRCGFNDGSGTETLQSGTAAWKGENNPQEVFAQMMEVHKTKARDEYKNPNWEKVVATSFSIVSF